jgi:hypothetical protein
MLITRELFLLTHNPKAAAHPGHPSGINENAKTEKGGKSRRPFQ